MSNQRARTYTFTWNHPTKEVEAHLKQLQGVAWMVVGREIAPTTKTPHLQGVVCFKSQRYFNAVKRTLFPSHVEIANNPLASIDYCKKEGDYFTVGDVPTPQKKQEARNKGGQSTKTAWENAIRLARVGEFDHVEPRIQICHYRGLEAVYHRNLNKQKLPDTEENMYWFWGPTGTGKSRLAREMWPDSYLKQCNKWWCGYTRQWTVLIDDFDKRHDILSHHLKVWADRYPFMAEIKGGNKVIRPKVIIVTSNYHPREIWSDSSDYDPLLRRFKTVWFGEGEPNFSAFWHLPEFKALNLITPPEMIPVNQNQEEEVADILNELKTVKKQKTTKIDDEVEIIEDDEEDEETEDDDCETLGSEDTEETERITDEDDEDDDEYTYSPREAPPVIPKLRLTQKNAKGIVIESTDEETEEESEMETPKRKKD